MMNTQQKSYVTLNSLTIGRGLAALFVAVHHATDIWGGLLAPIGNIGWLGVSYFYILSGFVLTWVFNPERTVSEFYRHRIARIYPMHLLTLLVSLTAFATLDSPLAGYVGTPWGTLANVFLVHDWIPGHPDIRQAWNGVSWSLSVEFFFYIFAPFLIAMLSRISAGRLVAIGIILYMTTSAIGIIASWKQIRWLADFMQYSPIARSPEFIYGIISAVLFRHGRRIHISAFVKYSCFLTIPLYYLIAHGNPNSLLMIDIAIPAFLVFILSGATRDLDGNPMGLAGRWLTKVGESSYSLYMTHALILGLFVGALHRYGVTMHASLAVLIFITVSVLFSFVMYRRVELPMRNAVLGMNFSIRRLFADS